MFFQAQNLFECFINFVYFFHLHCSPLSHFSLRAKVAFWATGDGFNIEIGTKPSCTTPSSFGGLRRTKQKSGSADVGASTISTCCPLVTVSLLEPAKAM